MKNRLKLFAALTLFSLTFLACSNDDNASDDSSPSGTSADQTAEIAQDGTWKITYFYDSDEDETSDFAGYVFTFAENGVLTAVKGSETVTGTWSVVDDSGNSSSDDDGNSSDDDDFNIFFPVPESDKFDDLIDDWDFISVSNTKIELIDVSGGNGGTDYLTFEKI